MSLNGEIKPKKAENMKAKLKHRLNTFTDQVDVLEMAKKDVEAEREERKHRKEEKRRRESYFPSLDAARDAQRKMALKPFTDLLPEWLTDLFTLEHNNVHQGLRFEQVKEPPCIEREKLERQVKKEELPKKALPIKFERTTTKEHLELMEIQSSSSEPEASDEEEKGKTKKPRTPQNEDEAQALLKENYVLTESQLKFCLQGLIKFPETPYLYYQSFIGSFLEDSPAGFREQFLDGCKVVHLTSGDVLFEASSESQNCIWYLRDGMVMLKEETSLYPHDDVHADFHERLPKIEARSLREGTLFGEEIPLGVYSRPPWSARAVRNSMSCRSRCSMSWRSWSSSRSSGRRSRTCS
jgi:hypothetical protein